MPSACSPFSLACLSLARVVVRSCRRLFAHVAGCSLASLFAHVAGRSLASLFAHVAGRSSFTRSRRCLLALPFSCVAIRSRRRTHRTPTHPVAHHHRSHVDWSSCLRCLRCLPVPLGTKNSRVFVVATSWLYGFGRVCIEVRLNCFFRTRVVGNLHPAFWFCRMWCWGGHAQCHSPEKFKACGAMKTHPTLADTLRGATNGAQKPQTGQHP